MTPERRSRDSAPWLLRAAALVSAMLFAAPGIYLVWRNFTTDADPGRLLVSERTLGPLWRTLQLAVLVSLATAVIGTGLAWLTTRTDLPFRRTFRVLLPLPLIYPSFIGAAAFVRTLNPGGLVNDVLADIGVDRTPQIGGLFGAWLVLTLFTYPYVYLPVAARMRMLPGSIEQSAALLGNSSFEVFRRIVIPQTLPSISAGALLVFLYAISDFGAVAILRYDTLTRAMEANYLANRPVALALSLLLLLLAAVVVTGERLMHSRRAHGAAVRSVDAARIPLGRWRAPALAAVGTVLAIALAAPVASLLDWSIRGLERGRRGGRGLTVDGAEIWQLTLNTFGVSALAAALTVLSVLPIAFLVARHDSKLGKLAHGVAVSTFAMPGLLIALAGIFWTLQWNWAFDTFNDTMTLLVGAYIVRFAALAMGTTLIAVGGVPERATDAARSLGAGRVRRLASVELPMMLPGLLAAGGLVMLSTMKELPISLLLKPIGFGTLATRIFGSFNESFVAEAGMMSLALVAISAVATWFLVIRQSERG